MVLLVKLHVIQYELQHHGLINVHVILCMGQKRKC